MWQINGEFLNVRISQVYFSYKTQGVNYLCRTKHTVKVDIFINVLYYVFD